MSGDKLPSHTNCVRHSWVSKAVYGANDEMSHVTRGLLYEKDNALLIRKKYDLLVYMQEDLGQAYM